MSLAAAMIANMSSVIQPRTPALVTPFRYWGKARPTAPGRDLHVLPYHCLDVAAVGRVFLSQSPQLRAWLGQRAWLARRGEQSGFAVEASSLQVEAYQQHDERADRTLQFTTVDFRGRLTVIDPYAFAAVLESGIGHAKAFGCGLLLIRRVG